MELHVKRKTQRDIFNLISSFVIMVVTVNVGLLLGNALVRSRLFRDTS